MKPATRLTAACILLLAATAAAATAFSGGDALNGQKLFEQHQCNHCHDQMMGGDGNRIFTRFDRKVNSASELVERIEMCSGNISANLTARDKLDLGAYLNRYYKLK
ncbi:MAG TPA: cytochrome c [Gallionella sp.]